MPETSLFASTQETRETHRPDWKGVFAGWFPETPRRGVLVTTFGEQIPFTGFLTSEDFLLLERTTPDTTGGRTLVLPYANVAAVKFTDVIKEKSFQAAGFQGSLPKK